MEQRPPRHVVPMRLARQKYRKERSELWHKPRGDAIVFQRSLSLNNGNKGAKVVPGTFYILEGSRPDLPENATLFRWRKTFPFPRKKMGAKKQVARPLSPVPCAIPSLFHVYMAYNGLKLCPRTYTRRSVSGSRLYAA